MSETIPQGSPHPAGPVSVPSLPDAGPPSDDAFARMLELTSLAPRAPRMMLWVIARLLVDGASPDALLIVSDALQEAANELETGGNAPEAKPLRAIGGMLSTEAIGRSGRGAFW